MLAPCTASCYHRKHPPRAGVAKTRVADPHQVLGAPRRSVSPRCAVRFGCCASRRRGLYAPGVHGGMHRGVCKPVSWPRVCHAPVTSRAQVHAHCPAPSGCACVWAGVDRKYAHSTFQRFGVAFCQNVSGKWPRFGAYVWKPTFPPQRFALRFGPRLRATHDAIANSPCALKSRPCYEESNRLCVAACDRLGGSVPTAELTATGHGHGYSRFVVTANSQP